MKFSLSFPMGVCETFEGTLNEAVERLRASSDTDNINTVPPQHGELARYVEWRDPGPNGPDWYFVGAITKVEDEVCDSPPDDVPSASMIDELRLIVKRKAQQYRADEPGIFPTDAHAEVSVIEQMMEGLDVLNREVERTLTKQPE